MNTDARITKTTEEIILFSCIGDEVKVKGRFIKTTGVVLLDEVQIQVVGGNWQSLCINSINHLARILNNLEEIYIFINEVIGKV